MQDTVTSSQTSADRVLVSIAVMLTTIMVVLDMTIVNVALPHMMGSLGATSEQVTWVLTSYMVSDAIFVALTGFLASRLGQRRLILICITGFVLSSALCGMAQSLSEMVVFRILQGCLGAPIIPLSQAIMVESFGRKERGKAMAIWGIGIMVAPVLGPTLGGYIIDHANWRWVFYINLPVGIISLLLALATVRNTARSMARIDWTGMALMIIGIGCLQLVLDRGNQEGWFNSSMITILSMASAIGLIAFALRGWNKKDNIINLSLFRDRNFATACSMMGAFGLGLFGIIAIQPIMLERLMGYPAELTGLVMAPRGIASAVGMFMCGQLINRFDPRYLVFVGICLASFGTLIMVSYTLDISPGWVVWPGVIQGLGMGLIFVTLSTLAYDTLPREVAAEAAGLFNLTRTVGSSIGISVIATVLTNRTQFHWQELGGYINPFNPNLQVWLNAHNLSLNNPNTAHQLANTLDRQAGMLAFIDAFWFVTISFLMMLPLVLLLRRPIHHPDPAALGH